MTVEDFMREQGQLVKKGTLSEDGSLEFWADGTTTARENGEEQAAESIQNLERPKGT
jgi:protein import protein ZIM17